MALSSPVDTQTLESAIRIAKYSKIENVTNMRPSCMLNYPEYNME